MLINTGLNIVEIHWYSMFLNYFYIFIDIHVSIMLVISSISAEDHHLLTLVVLHSCAT